MTDYYCNNCGKDGHLFSQCKIPITSFGIILFRKNPNGNIEYLMIRRKDTLGYIDFMRGKYTVNNKYYIMNMFNQMTAYEKTQLKNATFSQLWNNIWEKNIQISQYRSEELSSKEKFETLKRGIYNGDTLMYNLDNLIDESFDTHPLWLEPEWGFPKGRRNYREKDYECALREFTEETGYDTKHIKNIQNIFPFEEIFLGSNYKSYKHKYYLTYIDYEISVNYDINTFQKSEVSLMKWQTFNECITSIRNYNLERKRLLTNINFCLNKYKICQFL